VARNVAQNLILAAVTALATGTILSVDIAAPHKVAYNQLLSIEDMGRHDSTTVRGRRTARLLSTTYG
jgi:hypothetical protein